MQHSIRGRVKSFIIFIDFMNIKITCREAEPLGWTFANDHNDHRPCAASRCCLSGWGCGCLLLAELWAGPWVCVESVDRVVFCGTKSVKILTFSVSYHPSVRRWILHKSCFVNAAASQYGKQAELKAIWLRSICCKSCFSGVVLNTGA